MLEWTTNVYSILREINFKTMDCIEHLKDENEDAAKVVQGCLLYTSIKLGITKQPIKTSLSRDSGIFTSAIFSISSHLVAVFQSHITFIGHQRIVSYPHLY